MSITFGSGLVTVTMRWTAFKAMASLKSMSIQYSDDGDFYSVFGLDSSIAYLCNIWKDRFPQPDPDDYSREQNDSDLAEFEAFFKSRANRPTAPVLSDGRPRLSNEKPTGKRVTLYSHDWSDPTTWYSSSKFVSGEVMTDSGDHVTYSFAHQYVIDMYHGKLTGEDYLRDHDKRPYRVSVCVNGESRVEQDPHYGSDGHFIVDYVAGRVVFLAANGPDDTVTCDYHYATDSTFTVRPEPGTILRIEFAEVQFTTDVIITDSCTFQPYGLVDAFAPQLVQAGAVPSGTLIPLGIPAVYKSISDYQNDAVRAYPTYPMLGGSGWRGFDVPVVVFDWDYQTSTVLSSKAGMEVRLKLEHDSPFGGTYATATFYCVVEVET
jgi:hypothetical protein